MLLKRKLKGKLSCFHYISISNIKPFNRSELSESPKRSLLDSPSPTREQKARQAVAEATAASGAPKWKMQIGSATAGSSRFKKKPEREEWIEENEKRVNKNGDIEDSRKNLASVAPPIPEKNGNVRKMMAMKEPTPKKPPESELLKKLKPAPPAPKPVIPPGQVVLDKFGNFRLMTPPKETNRGSDDDLPPLPPGAPPKGSYAGIICLSEVAPNQLYCLNYFYFTSYII